MKKEKDKEDNKVKASEYENFTQAAFNWAKVFKVNKKLVHMDLSFNNFKEPDIKYISNFCLTFDY